MSVSPANAVMPFTRFFLIALGVAVLSYVLTPFGPLWLFPAAAWISIFVIGLFRYQWRGLWLLTQAPLAGWWAVAWFALNSCDIKLGPCM